MSGRTLTFQAVHPDLPQAIAPLLLSPLAQPQDGWAWMDQIRGVNNGGLENSRSRRSQVWVGINLVEAPMHHCTMKGWALTFPMPSKYSSWLFPTPRLILKTCDLEWSPALSKSMGWHRLSVLDWNDWTRTGWTNISFGYFSLWLLIMFLCFV